MLFSAIPHLNERKDADLIILPFWERQKKAKAAALIGPFESQVTPPIEAGDFKGKEGEMLLVYLTGAKEKRCLLLGLGHEEKLTVEKLRRALSNVVKECQRKGLSRINILLPHIAELRGITVEECLEGIAEGILLTNYRWEKLVAVDEETVLLKSVTLIGIRPEALRTVKTSEAIAEGVYFARDLINGNADIITPHYLAEAARKIAKKFSKVEATVHDKAWIEREKMGLLFAVGRGSPHEPAFIIVKYKGNPRSKDHTVLIGKGITFDTGGLNLKSSGMETMRDDMSGAAAVLATVATAASLDLKLNITAVVAAAENAIGGKSYKPGDVYQAYSGVTVEIGNTDAEGRLTLADALAYSVKNLKPTRMIDFATLTGSIVVALGEELSGLFCNNNHLVDQLMEASARTAEHLWRMPLFKSYKELIKSDIADLKNVGGRPGGPITAALFLQEFVKDVPWAHIDIAGTAFSSKERGYWPKNGVGFGVRLAVEFLRSIEK